MTVADAYSGANSATNATTPDLWVRRVLTLLERVIGERSHEVNAAGALVEAASLLREQIDAGAAVADGRGRLLAWQARTVRDYIDLHIAEPLRVADLCALLQLSEAHFSRSFRRTFGESPHGFLIRRRLQRAEQYMLQSDASLSEIALQCGFADQAHLSKHFRQHTGRTPASWRRARRVSMVAGPFESGIGIESRPGSNAGWATDRSIYRPSYFPSA
jgi:AraC family transcriptional regulator